MSPTKLQQHQNVADTLGAAVSKLRITVDDNLSAEEGIDTSEEAKSPTGADCVTSFLKCDQEFSLPQRKQLLQELFSLCLADVESDPRQQLLLANLAEDLLEAELQAHSGAEDKESSVEGAAWLRSSSSAASVFLTTYLRRPECEAAVIALLDNALDPAQSKNGPSSDPAILAERILRKLRPDAVPAGMRLLCRQLAALAPPGLREPLLGGFIILKFINPSLVSVPRSTHAQRVLVDVARHLQHLANHAATPDAARAKNADLDAFLTANRGAILAVFSSFS
ncbi:GTPase-activating protein [Hondaea fermentalgiana]|uniref:GTPase-activating protein n=1 Tax=Hondaea fermentalgiana TaxID=2315210 RepID=A0A2R5GJ80_9STRA|nr:GTPase-activating protein [Hondaea fermentalgiana]|eukprot:GBG30940.1 GTPase-activating protein [Hondaea fermentalgiana]